MHDVLIEVPEYLKAYQAELESWRARRATRMPLPKVPKNSPDRTVMMPMRDGIQLATELFFPSATTGAWPTILIRTPYPDTTFPFSARPIELFRRVLV